MISKMRLQQSSLHQPLESLHQIWLLLELRNLGLQQICQPILLSSNLQLHQPKHHWHWPKLQLYQSNFWLHEPKLQL